jgi:hypothetical protein
MKATARRYLVEIDNDKTVLLTGFPSYTIIKFTVISDRKKRVRTTKLFESDIQTVIHYPIPPHKQKALSEWNDLSSPITEKNS